MDGGWWPVPLRRPDDGPRPAPRGRRPFADGQRPRPRPGVLRDDRSGRLYQLTWDPYLRVGVHYGLNANRYDLWYPNNLTAIGGLQVTGTPSVVVDGSTTDVFARTSTGDLVEYQSPGIGGSSWSAYDLTVESGGPKVATDPAAFNDATTGEVRVASTELSPSPGHVVVYSPTDVGGRVWAAEDVTKATSTPVVSGGLAAVDGRLRSGALRRRADRRPPRVRRYGLGHDDVVGSSPTSRRRTQGCAADRGHARGGRVGYQALGRRGRRRVMGRPLRVEPGHEGIPLRGHRRLDHRARPGPHDRGDSGRRLLGRTAVHSSARASCVPAPEGTGVYAIPSGKWSQAVKDGWPVLGVTGGLGTTCAPWTGYVTPPKPDEQRARRVRGPGDPGRATCARPGSASGP